MSKKSKKVEKVRAKNLRFVQERDEKSGKGRIVCNTEGYFIVPAGATEAALLGIYRLQADGTLKRKWLHGFPPEFAQAELVTISQDEAHYFSVRFSLPNDTLDSPVHYYLDIRDPDAPEDE